jgi:hypothetical protein
MAFPVQDMLRPSTEWTEPFYRSVTAWVDGYKTWDDVQTCVDWFNENKVDPATVMEFWPTMAALCVGDHRLDHPVGRPKAPPGINAILPFLRSTRQLVATAALFPDPEPIDAEITVGLSEDRYYGNNKQFPLAVS